MSQMFQYDVWSPSMPDKLYTVDDLIDGVFYSKYRENLTSCVSFIFVGYINGVQCVCALMVTRLHIGNL